ncbi:CCA tRNA nucleotidyltransferase [Companilactobacillus mishanensis]|uniref:CCA-adding enzyme n=1 Tax=Companilactobacillus mishanensis TaxID=2486008 RepID=A0A5P0ZF94_9LACO|nr:CCA tRNA nucleotidyltransferase [Companilactobacillus mishanensis]MQS51712.1 CCA tRNA nucleotidyltransferase [Companilactobacillus mishanensis]
MQIKQLPTDFQQALPILEMIETAGFEAYFVGGSVRDHILGLPIHDVDIATSAYPEEIKSIFKHTVDTGIKHGTVTVLMNDNSYEITTFRTESGYQDYRRPDKVTFVRSLEDDLKRRDFTINALAVDRNGNVVDKFDGLTDLDNQIIRAVGVPEERFHEDALRMMRAVRFQSQLDFTIEPDTAAAIEDNAPLLEKIAVERIREEFIKMMIGRAWKIGFKEFLNLNLSEYCPEFAGQASKLNNLLSTEDFQMVDDEMAWTAIGFVLEHSEEKLSKFLRDWKVSNKSREACVSTMRILKLIQSNSLEIWDYYKDGLDNVSRAEKLAELFDIKFDREKLDKLIDAIPINSSHDLKISGNDVIKTLNIKPGPEIGFFMNKLEKAVVTQTVTNSYEDLQRYLLK